MELHLSNLLGISKKFFAKTIQWVVENRINLIEVGSIIAWALFVGRGFFIFDPDYMPIGNEFQMSIQSLYAWNWQPRCGTCMLWYEQINGGAPLLWNYPVRSCNRFTSLPPCFPATVDGERIDLEYSPWLQVELQPGKHHICFVSRPWDVWVGLLLTLVGIGL